MTSNVKPSARVGLLKRMLRDQAGNTLAMVAAGVIPVVGMVGGAVDMSRTYMAKARLQQACDAGSLAARREMDGDVLLDENIAVGNKYFDFNFPAGQYGVENLVRTYSQPKSDVGVLQPEVKGTVTADVPTTLMKIFGEDSISLTVNCASRQDVAHADVSMVLDVTHSMDWNMAKSSEGGSEKRIVALRRAVKAFYTSLGPGRAGGDTTKGRIRYAFVPYGTVANVGYLLKNDQMVNSHVYSSRGPITTTFQTWVEGSVAAGAFSTPAPASAPSSVVSAAADYRNFADFGTDTVGTDNSAPYETVTYTKLNGSTATVPKTVTAVPKAAPATGTETATSANCFRANLLAPRNNTTNPGLFDAMRDTAGTTTSDSITNVTTAAPVYPQTTRQKNVTRTITNKTNALRYKWLSVSGTSRCRLQSGTGNDDIEWDQTQTATGPAPITWTARTPSSNRFAYYPRTINVSGLKAGGSSWNQTLNVPNLDISGASWFQVKLSGNDKMPGSTTTDNWTQISNSGTSSTAVVTWRGCVEERLMDSTITSSSALSPLTANSWDLDTKRPANSGNNDSLWRPWLPGVFFRPDGTAQSEACPSPALKLQEIGSYTETDITTNYPMLFDPASGGASSYYYPYASGNNSSGKSRNKPSIENYIDRILLADGTLHDSGFIWGLHLLSGQGMFKSENPDYFDGTIVSRNLVFMTDGEMNPGEERYVFSGHNYVDGRMAPRGTTDSQMISRENRRMQMLCQAAKDQGIIVWVVVISDDEDQDFTPLIQCASSSDHYKAAATADDLVASFTAIAQSIGGLRLTE